MSSVNIVSYSKHWPLHFAQVRDDLLTGFGDIAVQIEHIGSTSVPGLAGKPVIDVLVGADSLAAVESRTVALERLRYRYISKYEHELPMRRYFVKAEGTDSLRVHVHAVVLGSSIWHQHIAFRNALRSDGSLFSEYHSLKMELAARFPHDKSSYTAAKAPFIRSALESLQAVGANNSFNPMPLRGTG